MHAVTPCMRTYGYVVVGSMVYIYIVIEGTSEPDDNTSNEGGTDSDMTVRHTIVSVLSC